MKSAEEIFDVVVIGGGPAGMMAALSATGAGAKVVLLEKGKIGTKLLLTGNGRCNITHEAGAREFAEKFGLQGPFLLSPLSIFGIGETEQFFRNNGLKLKTEEGGRVFPASDRAKEVLDVVSSLLKKRGVLILENSPVSEILSGDGMISGLVLSSGRKILGKGYIISAGGKSYPATGSAGDGFSFAKKLGHEIIPPKPALVPVEVKERWIKSLQGLSLKDAGISVIQNGKTTLKARGEIVFAHFGLGGPAILDLSCDLGDLLSRGKAKIAIDLAPGLRAEELEAKMQNIIDWNKNKLVENALKEIVPTKVVPFIMHFSGVEEGRKGCDLKKDERRKIAGTMKKLEVGVVGLLGFERAMATHGGVSLKEIDAKTMRSKLIPNLYFAGEVIDLDWPSGGYNLQMCWTTGYVAGQSAASGVK